MVGAQVGGGFVCCGRPWPTARSKLSAKSIGLPLARGKLICKFNFHKEGVNLPCRLYKSNKY